MRVDNQQKKDVRIVRIWLGRASEKSLIIPLCARGNANGRCILHFIFLDNFFYSVCM